MTHQLASKPVMRYFLVFRLLTPSAHGGEVAVFVSSRGLIGRLGVDGGHGFPKSNECRCFMRFCNHNGASHNYVSRSCDNATVPILARSCYWWKIMHMAGYVFPCNIVNLEVLCQSMLVFAVVGNLHLAGYKGWNKKTFLRMPKHIFFWLLAFLFFC